MGLPLLEFDLPGQTVTGRIVGVVQDPDWGSVANAQVSMLNQDTGLKWSYATDSLMRRIYVESMSRRPCVPAHTRAR